MLSIDFTATGTTSETVSLATTGLGQLVGTNISIYGDIGSSATVSFTNVRRIVVTDSGQSDNQALVLTGTYSTFSLDGGFSSTGVETVSVERQINVSVPSPTSSVSIIAPRSIYVGANITNDYGDVTLEANQQATASTGTFTGIDVNAATIRSYAGAITLKGRGGNIVGDISNNGVNVRGRGKVGDVSTKGPVTVIGTGGAAPAATWGVYVSGSGSQIMSAGGNVTVIGNGGNSPTGSYSVGVALDQSGTIWADGNGTLSVFGTGGASNGDNNYGVYLASGTISSLNGALSVVGQGGGIGSSALNIGIEMNGGAIATKAAMLVAGTGGNSTGANNHGFSVSGTYIFRASNDLTLKGIAQNLGFAIIIGFTSSSVIESLTGNVVIQANSAVINSAIQTSKTGSVSIVPTTPGTRIDLGGADVVNSSSPTLSISNVEINSISTGALQIGDAVSGPVYVSKAIQRTAKANLSLTTGSSISLGANFSSYDGDVNLNAVGPITQSNGVILTSRALTLNAPNQTATFNSLGNKAAQLVIPANVTAIVNGSFDSTGFVQVDGTLGGNGSVGVTTVSSTGRIKPGSGGPGKLTTGNIAFNSGSVVDVQLNDASYSQLAVTGTVNLGGATLQETSTLPNTGQVYRIIDNLGSGDVTGTFAGLSEGTTTTIGTTNYIVRYKDGTGNDVTLTPPVTVNSVVFGDGTDQRSLVKQLVVNFSQPVNFTADAFTLFRHGTGSPTDTVTLTTNPPSGSTSVVTITFAGSLTEFGSLIDGFYDLTIDATKISNADGNLDGDANGTFGGNYSVVGSTANKLFRFFGDSDGSGTVDMPDFDALRAVFNLPSNVFDFDNDGVTSLPDFARFRQRYGLSP